MSVTVYRQWRSPSGGAMLNMIRVPWRTHFRKSAAPFRVRKRGSSGSQGQLWNSRIPAKVDREIEYYRNDCLKSLTMRLEETHESNKKTLG